MKQQFKHAVFVSAMTLGTMGSLALTGCSDSDTADVIVNEEQSIVEIAAADERFSTLVTAIQEAGLEETLAGEGEFTVFAPLNSAFEALPEGTLEALLADPTGDLASILTYHVVSGTVDAAAVVELDQATTLNGEVVTIEVVDGEVILNGSVKVVTTDIIASNGIIHIIDGILLPEVEEVVDTTEVVDSTEVVDEVDLSELTITEIAVADSNFSTLVTALTEAELAGVLDGTDEYTVFAPTNAAFAALEDGVLESLLADPKGDLADILLYHVVEGKVDANTVVTLDNAPTVNGAKVGIEVVDGKVILNGTVEVTTTDIMAKNGIIHVIDAVLLPSAAPKNIVEIASGDDRFETLTTALTAAKLVDVLNDETAEFTVFAPTDDAFAALPEGTLDALLADPEGTLKDILLYHVVSGEVGAETVVTLPNARTVNGALVDIEIVDGKVILNGNAEVIITDIEATNGVIHVLDAVILPENAPKTITEFAAGDDRFETLTEALTASKLDAVLNDETADFTVFAPTDDAFAALPEGTLDALLADPEGALADILTYHVVSGSVDAATVVTLPFAETVNGANVGITVEGDNVFLNENAQVIITDVQTENGVIHVIDAVILPENGPKSITEIAAGDDRFETLTVALTAAKLDGVLNDDEADFTVFAPTDDAFAALPDGTLETLLADPEGQLAEILKYHVVSGSVDAATVVTLDSAPTLEGTDVTIEVVDGGVVLNGSVNVIITDIMATNGIVHVIDAVLTP